MKKHIVNIAWAIIAIPFYLLILMCCIYSRFIQFVFNERIENNGVYKWIYKLNAWVFNKKNKWL